MQLTDSVSVAKIKIIYASTQRAHSKPSAHSYDAAVHLTGDQWQCPFLMELNQWQLHYPFAEQVSQINGFVLKERKKAYIAGLGRDQLEHLASPMIKSESKYQRVQDKSEKIEKRLETGLEYYSPTANTNIFKAVFLSYKMICWYANQYF